MYPAAQGESACSPTHPLPGQLPAVGAAAVRAQGARGRAPQRACCSVERRHVFPDSSETGVREARCTSATTAVMHYFLVLHARPIFAAFFFFSPVKNADLFNVFSFLFQQFGGIERN